MRKKSDLASGVSVIRGRVSGKAWGRESRHHHHFEASSGVSRAALHHQTTSHQTLQLGRGGREYQQQLLSK
ncbi:hypothetical protein E2C01_039279 [Portunus trituberculatus]|uniref:Uncharacterized protein n=1 Tax=Portunus trituberculatus TaxID=210409 RepID=A0A5B7FJ95_PORTR|nr:hypothetical protein [Portunus trituberculatus]